MPATEGLQREGLAGARQGSRAFGGVWVPAERLLGSQHVILGLSRLHACLPRTHQRLWQRTLTLR